MLPIPSLLRRALAVLLVFAVAVCGGCGNTKKPRSSNAGSSETETEQDTASDGEPEGAPMMRRSHPVVNFDAWARVFPLTSIEDPEAEPHFAGTPANDPLDRRKAPGTWISSPKHLCEIELVRRRIQRTQDLGKPVPVDIFLWREKPAPKPYLTRLGGVPHRERSRAWPSVDGAACTFVAQFCFIDSQDIAPSKLPGDVLLVFFKDANGHYGGGEGIHLEWSPLELKQPYTKADCPKPGFPVPELTGVIHRTFEYPSSFEVFRNAGHYQPWFFSETQSTKIGTSANFIQNDPRGKDETLLCTLACLLPCKEWPLIDLAKLPEEKESEFYEWGPHRMALADAGCLYFLINKKGDVRCELSSH